MNLFDVFKAICRKLELARIGHDFHQTFEKVANNFITNLSPPVFFNSFSHFEQKTKNNAK